MTHNTIGEKTPVEHAGNRGNSIALRTDIRAWL